VVWFRLHSDVDEIDGNPVLLSTPMRPDCIGEVVGFMHGPSKACFPPPCREADHQYWDGHRTGIASWVSADIERRGGSPLRANMADVRGELGRPRTCKHYTFGEVASALWNNVATHLGL
jgi:hypothetical protein